QFARDAALFAGRVAAKCMLTAEARRQRALFERIVQRLLRREEVAQAQGQAFDELPQEDCARGPVEPSHDHLTREACRWRADIPPKAPPKPATTAGTLSSQAASIGHSDSAVRSPSPSRRERKRTQPSGKARGRRE